MGNFRKCIQLMPVPNKLYSWSYNFFINDLPDIICNVAIYVYADYTTLYSKCDQWDQASEFDSYLIHTKWTGVESDL